MPQMPCTESRAESLLHFTKSIGTEVATSGSMERLREVEPTHWANLVMLAAGGRLRLYIGTASTASST